VLVFRIIGGLLIIIIGAALVVFLVTRDKRWLRFVRQTAWFGLIILLIFLGLYALERLILVV